MEHINGIHVAALSIGNSEDASLPCSDGHGASLPILVIVIVDLYLYY